MSYIYVFHIYMFSYIYNIYIYIYIYIKPKRSVRRVIQDDIGEEIRDQIIY